MLPTLLVSCYQSNLQDEVEGFRRVWVISKSSLGDRDKAVSEHLLATKENNVLPLSVVKFHSSCRSVDIFLRGANIQKNELVARPSHHTIKMDALMRLQKREEMMCCP